MSVTFTVGYSRPMMGVVSKNGRWSSEPEFLSGVGHEGHDVGMPWWDPPLEEPLVPFSVAEGMIGNLQSYIDIQKWIIERRGSRQVYSIYRFKCGGSTSYMLTLQKAPSMFYLRRQLP